MMLEAASEVSSSPDALISQLRSAAAACASAPAGLPMASLLESAARMVQEATGEAAVQRGLAVAAQTIAAQLSIKCESLQAELAMRGGSTGGGTGGSTGGGTGGGRGAVDYARGDEGGESVRTGESFRTPRCEPRTAATLTSLNGDAVSVGGYQSVGGYKSWEPCSTFQSQGVTLTPPPPPPHWTCNIPPYPHISPPTQHLPLRYAAPPDAQVESK